MKDMTRRVLPRGGGLILVLGLVGLLVGPASGDTLMLCYGYGCKHSVPVRLGRDDWRAIEALFPVGRDAAGERTAIAQSIANLERIAGRQTPIHRDRGGNPLHAPRPGQLDCIDESLNTSAWLILLDHKGLLRWHRPAGRVYRAPFVLDQHWAARIQERSGGAEYAVDSWPHDNGQPAVVQPLADWRGKARPRQATLGPGRAGQPDDPEG